MIWPGRLSPPRGSAPITLSATVCLAGALALSADARAKSSPVPPSPPEPDAITGAARWSEELPTAADAAGGQTQTEAPEAESDPPALTVFVLPLRRDNAPRAMAERITAAVTDELARLPGLTVKTPEALDPFLWHRLQAAIESCADHPCTIEAASAAKADRLLVGTVARRDRKYFIELGWADGTFGEVLADGVRTQPLDAPEMTRASIRTLHEILDKANERDRLSRQRNERPTSLSAEINGGVGSRAGTEPYDLGLNVTAQLTWTPTWLPTGSFFAATFGTQLAHFSGRSSGAGGRVSYQRTQVIPFVEVRGGLPITPGGRTRLQGSAGLGVGIEWRAGDQRDGVEIGGVTAHEEVRASAGVWHQVSFHHSLVGGYRLRAQLTGRGADPISELVQPGSSRDTILLHELHGGWAYHF